MHPAQAGAQLPIATALPAAGYRPAPVRRGGMQGYIPTAATPAYAPGHMPSPRRRPGPSRLAPQSGRRGSPPGGASHRMPCTPAGRLPDCGRPALGATRISTACTTSACSLFRPGAGRGPVSLLRSQADADRRQGAPPTECPARRQGTCQTVGGPPSGRPGSALHLHNQRLLALSPRRRPGPSQLAPQSGRRGSPPGGASHRWPPARRRGACTRLWEARPRGDPDQHCTCTTSACSLCRPGAGRGPVSLHRASLGLEAPGTHSPMAGSPGYRRYDGRVRTRGHRPN